MKIPVHIIVEKRKREEEARRREEERRLPLMPSNRHKEKGPKREKERATNKVIVIEL